MLVLESFMVIDIGFIYSSLRPLLLMIILVQLRLSNSCRDGGIVWDAACLGRTIDAPGNSKGCLNLGATIDTPRNRKICSEQTMNQYWENVQNARTAKV